MSKDKGVRVREKLARKKARVSKGVRAKRRADHRAERRKAA